MNSKDIFRKEKIYTINNINDVEPDISVICDFSKLDDKGCHGAPDWIIEMFSPSWKNCFHKQALMKRNAYLQSNME